MIKRGIKKRKDDIKKRDRRDGMRKRINRIITREQLIKSVDSKWLLVSQAEY